MFHNWLEMSWVSYSAQFIVVIIHLFALCTPTNEQLSYCHIGLFENPDSSFVSYDCTRITYSPFDFTHLPNLTRVSINFQNCSDENFPTVLFSTTGHLVEKLIISARMSDNNSISIIPNWFFKGLDNLQALQLHGFEHDFPFIDSSNRLPNIRCLSLDGVGSISSVYWRLANFLRFLANTPIEGILLNNIKSPANIRDSCLNFSLVFSIPNVTIRHLSIDNSAVNSVCDTLSKVLPQLETFSVPTRTGWSHDKFYSWLVTRPVSSSCNEPLRLSKGANFQYQRSYCKTVFNPHTEWQFKHEKGCGPKLL